MDSDWSECGFVLNNPTDIEHAIEAPTSTMGFAKMVVIQIFRLQLHSRSAPFKQHGTGFAGCCLVWDQLKRFNDVEWKNVSKVTGHLRPLVFLLCSRHNQSV
jgi:hypothetical protein